MSRHMSVSVCVCARLCMYLSMCRSSVLSVFSLQNYAIGFLKESGVNGAEGPRGALSDHTIESYSTVSRRGGDSVSRFGTRSRTGSQPFWV